METDWKLLLQRYIEHVDCHEGVTFLTEYSIGHYGSPLTMEDLKKCRRAYDEYDEKPDESPS